jgi:hypothetical protein
MIEAVAWASAPEAAHSRPDSLAARSSASPLSVAATVRRFEQQVAEVSRWNDPRGIYAHCLCGEEY